MSLDATRRNPPAVQSDSVSIWMPLFINEHMAAASTLSHVEHSAMTYLQILFWKNGGTIQNDDKFLCRNLKLKPREWSGMKSVLLADCVITGQTITHPGIVEKVSKATGNREKNVAAAKARWAKRDAQNAMHMHNGCSANGMQRASEGEGNSSVPREVLSHGDSLEDGSPFRVIGGGK